MAEDVCKTVAFLDAYSDELVQLNKHTLEALLKSNRAKQVKEWNRAKKLFRSSIWFCHIWRERIIRRLGATPLWCVKFGVSGSSARTSEVLPTCGCLLKRTCRSLEKNFCSEFRHSLTKSSHAAIPHVHFYEVILGEVWEATWNRTSKSFVYVATEALRPEGAGPWSDAS